MTLGESHKKRIITGLTLAAVLTGCLIAGGWPLRLMLCAVVALSLWELYQMFWPGRGHLSCKITGVIAGVTITLGAGTCFDLGGVLGIIALGAMFTALRFLFLYGKGDDRATLQDNLPLIFGLIYIPLNLQFALKMPFVEQFLVILAAVASDIGAYYAGSNLGRHKICPRVSPNKSWEGSIGAILADMVIISAFTAIFTIPGMEAVPIWQWAAAGMILSVMAQLGDFFESAFKRAAGVKDSSKLLPGHGGLLDRLDSIVFVLPTYMLIKWLMLL